MVDIWEEKRGDLALFGIKGRLDASTAKLAEDRILALMQEGQNRIAVDLSELDYISSAGLQVLLLAAIRANDARGKVVLYALQDRVKQVLDIAGFSSIFSIYPTQDEALKGLA